MKTFQSFNFKTILSNICNHSFHKHFSIFRFLDFSHTHLFNNDVYHVDEIDQNENRREKETSWIFDPAWRFGAIHILRKHYFLSTAPFSRMF